MHQTFCCILRDICEGFLCSLEGIKQWDWSQVSATCPKSHFDCTDTSTCPWGLKPLFWIFLVVFITLTKSSVISSDQMSLNLSSTPMLPLSPSISLSLPFPTASLCFPHNYVPLHTHNLPSDPIKDLKYTIPPPDPPNPHFFLFPHYLCFDSCPHLHSTL